MTEVRFEPADYTRTPEQCQVFVDELTARGPERLNWLLDLACRHEGPDLDPDHVDLAGVRAVWDWLPVWAAGGRPGVDLTTPDGCDPRDQLPPWTRGSPTFQQHLLDHPDLQRNMIVLDACRHLVAAGLTTVDPTFRWAVYFHVPDHSNSAFDPAMVSDSHAWISVFNLARHHFINAPLNAVPRPPSRRDIDGYVLAKLREQGYQVDDAGHLLPGSTPPAPMPGRAPVEVTTHTPRREPPGDRNAEITIWASPTVSGLLHADDIDDQIADELENPLPHLHLDRPAVEAFLTALHLTRDTSTGGEDEECWAGPPPLPSPLSAALELHPDGRIRELTIDAKGVTDATLEHVFQELLRLFESTRAAAFITK